MGYTYCGWASLSADWRHMRLLVVVLIVCSIGVSLAQAPVKPAPSTEVPSTEAEVHGADGTHLAPPANPKHETVEETAQKAALELGDRVAKVEQELLHTGFFPAFVASLIMIILSEIGDKTFFIAAILAMRHNQVVVFLGAISALAVMTVLSAAMGFAAPALLPKTMTHYAGVLLFFYFGQQLLREGIQAEHGVSDELEETEEELAKKDDNDTPDIEEQTHKGKPPQTWAERVCSPTFVSTFSLTFFAEWGDRSQIATIALAAAKNPLGVTIGGILGHSLCTGLAVIGGRMLATKISEKTMLIAGGVVFLIFAVLDVIKGPE